MFHTQIYFSYIIIYSFNKITQQLFLAKKVLHLADMVNILESRFCVEVRVAL